MKFAIRLKRKLRSMINLLKKEKIHPVIVPIENEKLLEGKIALITGGSSGIGLAIAKAFIASGAKVVIFGTKEDKLKTALDELNKNTKEIAAKGLICNVTEIDTISNKVNKALKLFEDDRIDILVNSAGIISKHNFWNTNENDYDQLMNINTKGTFFMCQAVAKLMVERKIKGHILNVSSSSALRPAWTPYQMSKWAIRGFTLGLADTLLPYGIIVNAIAPGQTATPMFSIDTNDTIYNGNVPAKRYILPEEIAALAVHMVSGAGDMIVGDTIYITGGSGTISLHH